MSPNGGESWPAGSTQTITWSSSGLSGNVNIALLKAGSGYSAIATVPAAAGAYTWSLPHTLPVASDYSIRIVSATSQAVVDYSDSTFSVLASLSSITVVAPNGGESWPAGSTQTITWNQANLIGDVNIAVMKAGTGYMAVGTVPVTVGSFTWTVPYTMPVASDYSIRVMSASVPSILDLSDATFSVAPSATTVTVVSPNGGETWQFGSTQTITWTSTALTGNVNIALLKAGTGYKTVATVPVSAGTYTWTLPKSVKVGTDYKIRITSASIPSILDISDASFSVTTQPASTMLLSVSPSTVDFGSVTTGNSASSTITLTNSGNSNVTLYSGGTTGLGYSFSGLNFPDTLIPGATRSFTVTFNAQTTGLDAGSISVVSDATNSPTVVTTSGTGVAPIQHSVQLTWNASTSTVSGYNIYRGTITGGPYSKLNSILGTGVSYVDKTVTSGAKYFYVVTAVDSAGLESQQSQEVAAAIPNP